ncbi:hypothetical protein COCSUDRAFT_34231 [Coccomyxa subellipsoidea C-169]|uniref:Uncharacterized protein n=1 Tax=Coccomyxa subellipsoidea (strain C-169) TaxID=574566 RepID=I0YMY5_COCSC|nr:hypothetical protein COCSUDRAFT_34231 [Coccomyxa subellipsoidea C-169]EIE19754.1 hypothetical protein COCSUDRAFT_34231 [Coccomyxa subellipsoidea C-169]|eukprot:XP_005644298.1 hypothetical protein COCSUDRAFT_34231 [Coccomyxa subellipsoidea C-169]
MKECHDKQEIAFHFVEITTVSKSPSSQSQILLSSLISLEETHHSFFRMHSSTTHSSSCQHCLARPHFLSIPSAVPTEQLSAF